MKWLQGDWRGPRCVLIGLKYFDFLNPCTSLTAPATLSRAWMIIVSDFKLFDNERWRGGRFGVGLCGVEVRD